MLTAFRWDRRTPRGTFHTPFAPKSVPLHCQRAMSFCGQTKSDIIGLQHSRLGDMTVSVSCTKGIQQHALHSSLATSCTSKADAKSKTAGLQHARHKHPTCAHNACNHPAAMARPHLPHGPELHPRSSFLPQHTKSPAGEFRSEILCAFAVQMGKRYHPRSISLYHGVLNEGPRR